MKVTKVNSSYCTWIRWRYPLEIESADSINRYFAEQREKNPSLWEGPVLMSCRNVIINNKFYCTFFTCNYSTFLALRDKIIEDKNRYRRIRNVSTISLIRSSECKILVGKMSATTATSGSVVCPGGIPDLDDISEDRIVDLDGSVVRETLEETGLDISQYINKSWLVIEGDGNKVILGKIVSIDKPSKDILSLANHNTEFESTYFTDKIDPNTPRYIKTALGAVL